MRYLLTKKEYELLKQSGQKEINQLKAECLDLRCKNNRLQFQLDNQRKKALNIGTYDFKTAEIIEKQLKSVRKNKQIGQYGLRVKGIRKRGRGTRKFDDLPYRLDQSLPLDRAEKVAIYVDCIS